MKKFAFLCVLGICVWACQEKKEITGFIEGWGNDTIWVRSLVIGLEDSETVEDTIVAENGHFSYKLPVKDAQGVSFVRAKNTIVRPGAYYALEAHTINLYLLPGERVSIKGNATDKAVYYRAKGPKFLVQQSELRDEYLPNLIIADSLNTIIERDLAMDLGTVFAARNVANGRNRAIGLKYVLTHPDHELSGLLLGWQAPDTLAKYYELLAPEVRNQGLSKIVLDLILEGNKEYFAYKENLEKIKVGNPAPDFVLMDIDNKPFKLYDQSSDKYIMLDFWGGWCGPCVQGIPQMKEYYKKYSAKVLFVSIDCQEEEEAWRAAVEKYQMPWVHLIEDVSIPIERLSIPYAVGGYPTKILLAPDKTIAGIFLGEGEDFYKKMDELFR